MILVTGASGFVGSALCETLFADGWQVRGTVRGERARKGTKALSDEDRGEEAGDWVVVGDIGPETDWSEALDGVDVVIHCAARAHIMNDSAADPLAEFRKVNTAGTLNLARQAVAAGGRRFIYLSSVKVNGEETGERSRKGAMALRDKDRGAAFSEGDVACPQDAYAVSKWEAEQGLMAIAEDTGLEVVIVRPPLVYGANAPGNFGRLMKWVQGGVPLPLGAVHNKRSFVALDNLVSFIVHCIDHPRAANEVFLVSDDEDLSTTELLQKMARALGKRSLLLSVPVGLMRFVADLIGKKDVADRLFGSLQVDSSKARELPGWEPVVSVDEALAETAQAYLSEKANK